MSIFPLNALNFFMADVRDGLGPFLGIFLQQQGWDVDDIGFVMTLSGLIAVIFTTPIGVLVDVLRAKRAIIIFSALTIIVACGVNYFYPTQVTTTIAQMLVAVAGATIPPAITGITLGIVGRDKFDHQLGQNESYSHAGNAFSAMMAGVFSFYYGLSAVFALMGLWTLLSIVSVLLIRQNQIDYNQSRGLAISEKSPKSIKYLLTNKGLVILAVTVVFFHLANAAMLPLLSQSMVANGSIDRPGWYTAMTVIIAQITMIPMALYAAHISEKKGYSAIFIIALVALPIRGLLAGLIPHPAIVIPVQILDGIAAGLMGVAVPGIVARILNGTGRFNTGFAMVLTLQGVGAALSSSIAGVIAKFFDYDIAFLVLSSLAIVGLLIWLFCTSYMSRYNTKNSV